MTTTTSELSAHPHGFYHPALEFPMFEESARKMPSAFVAGGTIAVTNTCPLCSGKGTLKKYVTKTEIVSATWYGSPAKTASTKTIAEDVTCDKCSGTGKATEQVSLKELLDLEAPAMRVIAKDAAELAATSMKAYIKDQIAAHEAKPALLAESFKTQLVEQVYKRLLESLASNRTFDITLPQREVDRIADLVTKQVRKVLDDANLSRTDITNDVLRDIADSLHDKYGSDDDDDDDDW